jgi:hypothetical protein
MNPYLQQTLNPFKRWWELQQQYAQQGMGLMAPQEEDSTLKDVGTGLLGGAMYAASPIISGFQAFRDEPLRDTMIQAGMDPEKAQTAAHWIGGAMDVGGIGLAKKGLNIGSEVARRVGPKTGGLNAGNPALGMEITRRAKAYQTEHPQGDWYKGARLKHLAHMPGAVMRNLAQRLVDPRASYIFSKYGIDHLPKKELEKLFKFQRRLESEGVVLKKTPKGEDAPFKWVKDEKTGREVRQTESGINPVVNPDTVRNEIHSQLEYIDSIFQKYLPDDARRVNFERELIGDLFPRHHLTTAENMASETQQIRNVIGVPNQITDNMINAHISAPMIKDFKLEGPLALNAKPFHMEPGTAEFRGHSTRRSVGGAKYHGRKRQPGFRESLKAKLKREKLELTPDKSPVYAFQELWRELPSGTPLTKDNIISYAEKLNKQLDTRADDAFGLELQQSTDAVYKSSQKPKGIKKGDKRYTNEEALNRAQKAAEEVYNKAWRYDIDMLKNAIKEEAGAISVGGPTLSGDRLLAHVQNRLIIPKTSANKFSPGGMRQGEGIWVTYDWMKQGSGMPGLEQALEAGRKYNFMAVDITPVRKIRDSSGEIAIRSGAKAKTELGTRSVKQTIPGTVPEKDIRIRRAAEKMMYDRPDAAYLRRWGAKRAAGAGAIGAPVGAGLLSDDERKRKRGAGLLAY